MRKQVHTRTDCGITQYASTANTLRDVEVKSTVEILTDEKSVSVFVGIYEDYQLASSARISGAYSPDDADRYADHLIEHANAVKAAAAVMRKERGE